jgi:UDP-glucose 4-epimerase
MSILVMESAASIQNHTCVKILNSDKSMVVVVGHFWNSEPQSIPRILQITDKNFPFYEINLIDRHSLAKLFIQNEISAVIDFIVLQTIRKSFQIPITIYHNNLNHFIFVELMTKSNITNIVFSSSAIVWRLKAKLLSKATNPSNSTKQFLEEMQTNVGKSNQYLNTLYGHESELMGEDRNNFVESFCELGIGIESLPELNVFRNDSHTIDVTEVKDCIYFVDNTAKYLWGMDYCLWYQRVKAVEVGRGNANLDSDFEKVKVFETTNGRRVKSEIVGKCEGDIEICFMEGWKVKLFFGSEVEEDIDGTCFDPARLNEENLENSLDLSDYDIYRKSSGDILRFATNAEELSEWVMIEEGIEHEKSKMKFELDEIDGQRVYFEWGFCRFVEEFGFFDISLFGCIDVIRSTRSVFPCICPLWSLFNLITHENENGNGNGNVKLNGLWTKGVMMKNLKIIYLVITNDGTDCHRFFSEFFSENTSKSSVERNQYFFSSAFVMEMEMAMIFGERMMRSEWNGTEFLKNQMFWYGDNENENENVANEMYEIRHILELSGGSRIEGFSSFSGQKPAEVIEIDDSVEIVREGDFHGYTSLNMIIFASSNVLREISGFRECASLCRIELPSSVEVIGEYGFDKCTSLTEVVFSSSSHLRQVSGFDGCTSLCRIELPSSVEVIGNYGFSRCISLNEVVFSSSSHLNKISGFSGCTSLCRIEFPSSVEVIGKYGFDECTSLNEVVFSSSSHLNKISGFSGCTSLCRIALPSSVEVIGDDGFRRCASLNEVVFSSGRHLRQVSGFRGCTSLYRIELPSSIEVIGYYGFRDCTSLNEIVFSSGSHLRNISRFCGCTSLCRIELPLSVEVIGSDDFRKSTSLRVVIVGAGCTGGSKSSCPRVFSKTSE